MKNLLFSTVLFVLISEIALGDCIDPKDISVPVCPVGKTQALDDTYPAAYVTIGPGSMGIEFVVKAIEADPKAKIVLSGWQGSQIEDLRTALKTRTPGDTSFQKRIITASTMPMAQWQQDYLQSEFDLSTGLPIIRPIKGYFSNRDKNSNLTDQTLAKYFASTFVKEGVFCDGSASVGSPLPKQLRIKNPEDSSYYGGNLEGFPGGLCLVGDTLPPESFNDFCKGKNELAVVIPTKFLLVGHVDEVVSVVKDNTAKAPCNYAVLRASPKKALDLLKHASSEDSESKFQIISDDQETTATQICESWKSFHPNASVPLREPVKAQRGARFIFPKLMPTANAQTGIHWDRSEEELKCLHMKNADAYIGLNNDSALYDYNMLVEDEMAEAEKTIRQKAAAGGCPNIKIIPVPNLFHGNVMGKHWKSKAKISITLMNGTLLKKSVSEISAAEMDKISPAQRIDLLSEEVEARTGEAINPNPTNSVSLGNTLIFPDQKNKIFQNYLTHNVAESVGLKADFVDTWDSAHTQDGNLHCSTNAVRYCRPK